MAAFRSSGMGARYAYNTEISQAKKRMSPGDNPLGLSGSKPSEKPKLPADGGVHEDVGTIALNPDRLYAPSAGKNDARQGRTEVVSPETLDDAQLMLRV